MEMRTPKTLHELTAALAGIMAGSINGTVDAEPARIALNAATRIIEAVQAETRIRALAFTTGQIVSPAIPLDSPIWPGSPGASVSRPKSIK